MIGSLLAISLKILGAFVVILGLAAVALVLRVSYGALSLDPLTPLIEDALSAEDGSYRVTKAVRDCCVFARQNLTKDPPFSKLDVISCRNVMIYLGSVLQRKVMSIALMPGSRLGNGCILGEGTLVRPGTVIPAGSVLVGRPPHVIRSATDADRERLAVLRQHQINLTDYPGTIVPGPMRAGESMGTLYAYRDKVPSIGAGTVLFDSAEITGDVVIGEDTLIGAGVKIIGDSHGPVRIGSRVQILENTVLHLLPDNALVIDDDAVIGPGAMIHGCHIGRSSIVGHSNTITSPCRGLRSPGSRRPVSGSSAPYTTLFTSRKSPTRRVLSMLPLGILNASITKVLIRRNRETDTVMTLAHSQTNPNASRRRETC